MESPFFFTCVIYMHGLVQCFVRFSLFFLLQRDVVSSYLDSGRPVDEQGVEDAFELLHEMNERVRTGLWVGDCFIYNNSSWRLNYCVGGEVCHHPSFVWKSFSYPVIIHAHGFDEVMNVDCLIYLLLHVFRWQRCSIWTDPCTCWGILLAKAGYIWLTKSSSKLGSSLCLKVVKFLFIALWYMLPLPFLSYLSFFFFFWVYSVMGYTLLLSLIEYKTLVMRGDLERANQLLPSIPKEHHNRYIKNLSLEQCCIC